jgi:hypothetical protein
MEAKVYKYLLSRPDILHFVRMNPMWYRRLTRYPESMQMLESASKEFYGKTFYQKVGKVNDQINLLTMLMSMSEVLKEQND